MPYWVIPASFFLIELFGFCFLSGGGALWPLAFGLLWAGILGGFLRLLPRKGARIGYGVLYLLSLVYAGFQTGYYILFSGMMWLSDFRYASEGADYAQVLLTYPIGWWRGLAGLILLGGFVLWKFPKEPSGGNRVLAAILAAASAVGAWFLPEAVF